MGAYDALVWLEIGLAAVTFAALMFVTAPYGRHVRQGWGPTISDRMGWILMEAPAVIVFLAVFLAGDGRSHVVPLVFLGLWQIHYVHRTFIFPLRRPGRKSMPVLVAVLALAFNTLNAGINAYWVGHLGNYATSWLSDPRFLLGVTIFAVGLVVNIQSDNILLRLRAPGEIGYKIPRGGLYRHVSCPNYLGEMLEWIGWAIATWSLAGLAFALYTIANLVPRALQNHRWYKATFPDYPPRKAVIPKIL